MTGTTEKFNVRINVSGGGPNGQAGAVRHGISRALLQFDATLRGALKCRGLPDARFTHERAQEIRPAGCAQTFPIQQTLIALEISKPRWFNPAGFFVLAPVGG